ncbi:MAG: hypothetical protein GX579_04980 [Chloroflexi bacterium]|jgi:hypothetical protein|nr:hypothetical protein [Chloroflexota bacterium]
MGHPFPEPHLPELPVQPATPVIYVAEPVLWEYKQLARDLEREELLDEAELNRLGEEGWELAAALAHGEQATYIFKRIRA